MMAEFQSLRAYWGKVLAEATKLAASGFGRPIEILTLFVVSAAGLFLARRSGTDAAMFAKLDDYILALEAALLAAVVLFVFALVIAPWKLHRAQEAELIAIKSAMDSLAEKLVPKLAFAFDRDYCCVLAVTPGELAGASHPFSGKEYQWCEDRRRQSLHQRFRR